MINENKNEYKLKYIISDIEELFIKRNINYNGVRLKTTHIINLIDMFLNRYLIYKKDYLKLNSRILKKIYGSNYNKYLLYLIDKNIIYLHKNYSAGYKSKCFKLTKSIKEKNYTVVNIQYNKKFLQKVNNNHIEKNVINNNIKNKLINDLYKVNINPICLNYINNNITDNNSKIINLNTVNKIINKDIFYSTDSYGRFHTNFTILKKHIRINYLSINNNILTELDIVNSQPFFLYIALKNNKHINYSNYDKNVLEGTIYDIFAKELNITRKEAKVEIYSVLFGKNISDKSNQLFKQLYPEVYEYILQYKKENKSYKSLARYLQKIESDFIFNKLIPKIIEQNNIPIITIHDSILIENQYYNQVKQIFDKEYNKLLL